MVKYLIPGRSAEPNLNYAYKERRMAINASLTCRKKNNARTNIYRFCRRVTRKFAHARNILWSLCLKWHTLLRTALYTHTLTTHTYTYIMTHKRFIQQRRCTRSFNKFSIRRRGAIIERRRDVTAGCNYFTQIVVPLMQSQRALSNARVSLVAVAINRDFLVT